MSVGGTRKSFPARIALAAILVAGALAACSVSALGFWENDPSYPNWPPAGGFDLDCYQPCHDPGSFFQGTGSHGNYTTSTDACDNCHTVHEAGGSLKLLPADTVKDSCLSCHDGTGGGGVYGAVFAATGASPGAAHSIDTTSVIPGGDASTGGDATRVFGGEGGALTCSDCHSPHGSNVVEPFYGERYRSILMGFFEFNTSKLLRRQPTGASVETTAYGSDWCAGCHEGRTSGGVVHNHPVETSATAGGDPFHYNRVAVLASDSPTSSTIVTGLVVGSGGPGTSAQRGFLMPYPRTAEQSGHAPICQQCHEDSRNVGTLVGDGTIGDAEASVITSPDGTAPADNPRFQNFPHETVNPTLLVETDDDLCMNCHPVAGLP